MQNFQKGKKMKRKSSGKLFVKSSQMINSVNGPRISRGGIRF